MKINGTVNTRFAVTINIKDKEFKVDGTFATASHANGGTHNCITLRAAHNGKDVLSITGDEFGSLYEVIGQNKVHKVGAFISADNLINFAALRLEEEFS